MNSCNNPRQNMAAGVRQGSCRNMPGQPVGCDQRMPEKRNCEMNEKKEEKWPLGMTYVPWQEWRELYPLEEGFHCGTIFKELNLPFTERGMC